MKDQSNEAVLRQRFLDLEIVLSDLNKHYEYHMGYYRLAPRAQTPKRLNDITARTLALRAKQTELFLVIEESTLPYEQKRLLTIIRKKGALLDRALALTDDVPRFMHVLFQLTAGESRRCLEQWVVNHLYSYLKFDHGAANKQEAHVFLQELSLHHVLFQLSEKEIGQSSWNDLGAALFRKVHQALHNIDQPAAKAWQQLKH